MTGDKELAEAMLTQYRRKDSEVAEAIGEEREDYLQESRKITKTKLAIFTFKKVTVKEVKQQIRDVDDKESFGHGKILYGFMKKMSKWVVRKSQRLLTSVWTDSQSKAII